MQRKASLSRFSLESADYPVAPTPPGPKPLGKLGKLLRLKADPFTSNGKYHATGLLSDGVQSLTFDSPLSYSASFRSRPKNMTANNPKSMCDASHYRNLHHSVSAPAIRVSVLRPSRISSMNAHSSIITDPSDKTTIPPSGSSDEPRLFPVRRRHESSIGAPQVISEKKSKWSWKGRMAFIPKHSRSPSPVAQRDEIRELPVTTLSIVDISAPPCLLPIAGETPLTQLPGPSSPPAMDDLCLTPTSTRSSSLSESEQPTRHKSQRSRGSINKVSRTLGFPEITFATEFGEIPLSASYDSYNPFDSLDLYPVRKQPSVKLSRRLSLTLSNLTAIPTFFRPSSATQPTSPASHSQTSLSTLDADDVHQFGLADDLSDSWGKIPESRTNSSDLQVSPITFHAPTHVPPPSSSGDMKLNIPEEVSSPFPTLTCGRSQSHSSLRRVAGTASRPHTPFDERNNPPVQAIRLSSKSTPLYHNKDPAPQQVVPKTWNSEWNQDDWQDIIKKLRYLK